MTILFKFTVTSFVCPPNQR